MLLKTLISYDCVYMWELRNDLPPGARVALIWYQPIVDRQGMLLNMLISYDCVYMWELRNDLPPGARVAPIWYQPIGYWLIGPYSLISVLVVLLPICTANSDFPMHIFNVLSCVGHLSSLRYENVQTRLLITGHFERTH